MKLTWFGHACFKVTSGGYSIVIDPFAPGYVPGLPDIDTSANEVLCSHGHGDHNCVDAVNIESAACESPFRISTLSCWHDDARGAKRGENTIHILQAEGLRVVHLGDLGHLLSEEQAASIGSPDLLMIPVGGFYTIDAKQAARTVEQLSPRIVVPMHFRGKGFGFDNIAPVKDFLKLVRYPQRSFDSSSMEFTAGDECFTALLTCPVKKKR